MVPGSLPKPALAFDHEGHGNQFVRVIYSRDVDEKSFGVNLTDEVGSGLGKHDSRRRAPQTAGRERNERFQLGLNFSPTATLMCFI